MRGLLAYLFLDPANEEIGETTHVVGWEESPQCLDVHPRALREMLLSAAWLSVVLTFGKGGGIHPQM